MTQDTRAYPTRRLLLPSVLGLRKRQEFLANATLEARLEKIEKTLLSHGTALRDVIQKLRRLLLPPPDRPSPASDLIPRTKNNSSKSPLCYALGMIQTVGAIIDERGVVRLPATPTPPSGAALKTDAMFCFLKYSSKGLDTRARASAATAAGKVNGKENITYRVTALVTMESCSTPSFADSMRVFLSS